MIAKLFKWSLFAFLSVFILGIICTIYFNSSKFYELREFFNENSISNNTKNNLTVKKVDVYWYSDFNSGQIIKSEETTDLFYKNMVKTNF